MMSSILLVGDPLAIVGTVLFQLLLIGTLEPS